MILQFKLEVGNVRYSAKSLKTWYNASRKLIRSQRVYVLVSGNVILKTYGEN